MHFYRFMAEKITKRGLLPAVLVFSCTACQNDLPAFGISRFEGTPAEAVVGQKVTLSWQGRGAASCNLTTGQRRLTPESCEQGEVTKTYTAPGTFIAGLEYTAPDGSTLLRETTVSVVATEETFSATPAGLDVAFDAAALGAPAGSSFTWTFGDGQTGTGRAVTHRYATPGQYSVELNVGGAGFEAHRERQVTLTAASGRRTLFAGDGLGAWELVRGGAANWRLGTDPAGAAYFEVAPGPRVGSNNLRTREVFGDVHLHLEFWVPRTPPGTPEQARSNSGVYLQGRYEVQILDSYGQTLSGQNDAGALYEVQDAVRNASLPAETWQTYDLIFRAARFEDGRKTQPARVSVFWNDELVQDETPLSGPTRLGAPEVGGDGVLTGPVVLQDHGDRVRYRNVWLEPLAP